MSRRVVVWGTGNVGRPALRAVLSHRDLERVGAVVANPGEVGRAAGRAGLWLQGLGGWKRKLAASPAATFASRP
jgi:hypothetical protein